MTAARMTANRENAQHSTGPQDTARTRFNGVQHGLTSKQTVIPGESQHEYDEFREEFLSDLNPQSAIERTLADRAIAAAWRLKRFQGVESAFFNDCVSAFLNDNPDADPAAAMANLFIDPVETKKMSLFLRYQTAVQREYDKAISEFKKARAEREKEQFEQAMVEAAKQRSAVGGFASYNAPPRAATATQSQESDPPSVERSNLDTCATLNFHAGKAVRTQRDRIEVA